MLQLFWGLWGLGPYLQLVTEKIGLLGCVGFSDLWLFNWCSNRFDLLKGHYIKYGIRFITILGIWWSNNEHNGLAGCRWFVVVKVVLQYLLSSIGGVLFALEKIIFQYLSCPFLFCTRCSQSIMWLINMFVKHAYVAVQLILFPNNTNIKSLIKEHKLKSPSDECRWRKPI
jgi:hypothetical protein